MIKIMQNRGKMKAQIQNFRESKPENTTKVIDN